MSINSPQRGEERLEQKQPEQELDQLTMEELLGLIIRQRNGSESRLITARRLCTDYGARALTTGISVTELSRLARLTQPLAARILASIELGRRIFQPDGSDYPLINGPADIYAYSWEMKRLRQEQFRSLYLNTAHRIIADRIISIGSINSSLVHPREVFHGAIQHSAAAIILIHNHPSGNPEPSGQDLHLTRQLQEAGRLLSITILDHLIIGREGYYSFKEHGRL